MGNLKKSKESPPKMSFLGPLPARLGRGPHEVKKNKTYSSHFNDIEKLGYGFLTHLPS